MAGVRGNGSEQSLPPLQPKSPPEYPDLYGKRREMATVQMLEREIGFLKEELKSVEGLQPASRSCKEVADFVTGNEDPLVPTAKKKHRSCRFWNWLCQVSCFNVSWACCCSYSPHCCHCHCNVCNCYSSNPCGNCNSSRCHCFSGWSGQCFNKLKCSLSCCCCCCMPKCPYPTCSSKRCTCYPKCPKLNNICSCSHKSCCRSLYFCC